MTILKEDEQEVKAGKRPILGTEKEITFAFPSGPTKICGRDHVCFWTKQVSGFPFFDQLLENAQYFTVIWILFLFPININLPQL